jgi:hypothetical protein
MKRYMLEVKLGHFRPLALPKRTGRRGHYFHVPLRVAEIDQKDVAPKVARAIYLFYVDHLCGMLSSRLAV